MQILLFKWKGKVNVTLKNYATVLGQIFLSFSFTIQK